MTTHQPDKDTEPRPLHAGGDGGPDHAAMQALLDQVPNPSGDPPGVEHMWRQIRAPVRGATRRWLIPLTVAGGCAALGLMLRVAHPRPTPVVPTSEPSARLELATGTVSTEGGLPLTAGAELERNSLVQVGADARAIVDVARARVLLSAETGLSLPSLGADTTLNLKAGALLADVETRRSGEAFQVQAGNYLVTVKGTLFRVRRAATGDLEVSCTRGRVEVSLGGDRWSVPAGRSWSSLHPTALAADNIPIDDRRLLEGEPPVALTPVATPTPASPVAPPAETRPRLAVAETAPRADAYASAVALDRQGRHAEAAAALRLIVAQKLPNAELALYHLAQLEQGPLADAAGAERDYLRYEKDYPQGALAQEAALSAIELTLKRGGFPDALGEMDRFLRAHPASERISTVHLLRGNVLRSQGNPQDALAEYAQVHGPQTEEDDALYFTALCHASGGSADAERAALSAYLQRFPAGKHVPDVRARLAQ